MKKVNGKTKESLNSIGLKHYETLHEYTGEIVTRQSEYITMSLKPGIAHDYYQKYKSEIFPADSIIYKGKELQPPKYYAALYQIDDEEKYDILKATRISSMKTPQAKFNSTPERLAVQEKVKKAMYKKLTRPYEEDNNGT